VSNVSAGLLWTISTSKRLADLTGSCEVADINSNLLSAEKSTSQLSWANKPLRGESSLPEDSDYYYTLKDIAVRNVRYSYPVTIYGY
jgi:hypothetical protein